MSNTDTHEQDHFIRVSERTRFTISLNINAIIMSTSSASPERVWRENRYRLDSQPHTHSHTYHLPTILQHLNIITEERKTNMERTGDEQ